MKTVIWGGCETGVESMDGSCYRQPMLEQVSQSVGLPNGMLRRPVPASARIRTIRRGLLDHWRLVGDVVSGRRRPHPSFIIAGGMRCGTTSLHATLARHPQLCASYHKEVHYFDLHHRLGAGWYARQFPKPRRLPDGSDTRAFESSPYYMFDPRVPERMREMLPEVRILFLLRDPVERAISHYRKNIRDGREHLAFGDAIDAEDDRLAGEEERLIADPHYVSEVHRYASYKARGRYADLIARFQPLFPAGQILAVDAGRLFAEPSTVVAEICRFLGIDPWQPEQFAAANVSRQDYVVEESVRRRLEEVFEPHEHALERMLGWRPSVWGARRMAG